MNRKKLLSLFGIKWNPFTPDVPTDSLCASPRIEGFCSRVEGMIHDGGFALVTGDPGCGKSATLRILSERLASLPDVTVGVLTRPQSSLADFYRELGEVFSVELRPHNRWGGFKALRERWKAHAESSLLRPVLLVDEGQEMHSSVLSELRLLSSGPFDAECYLTITLAADGRLLQRLSQPDLLPLGSRIRTRLALDYASTEELHQVLRHGLKRAGNPNLLTQPLQDTLVEHCAGNLRVLMTMAGELLLAACERELPEIDEKLYLQLFQTRSPRRRPAAAASRRRSAAGV